MKVEADEGVHQDVLIEEGHTQEFDGALFVVAYRLIVDLQDFGDLPIG